MEIETKPKPKIDVKKVLVTLALVLFAAGVIGGGVYYVLNQNFKKEREASEEAIKDVQVQKLEEEKKTEKPGSTALVADTTQLLESFCEADAVDSTVGSISYMKNSNGEFGNCGMNGEGGGGAMLIAKKVNNDWTKIWIGNGTIEESLCDQYKIPNKMSGGTCNY